MSKHDALPDVKVAVSIAGGAVAVFSFWKVAYAPQNWEITAALIDEGTRAAVRACLLACIAEIQTGRWEPVSGIPAEFGGEGAEQLPFER